MSLMTVRVQVERQPHSLGSAVQTQTRDHREVPQSDGRQVAAVDGQREGRCQVYSLLLQVFQGRNTE